MILLLNEKLYQEAIQIGRHSGNNIHSSVSLTLT
jgi:hypothetical protein